MANFINNALAQLFDRIEENSYVKFSSFTTNDRPPEQKSINSNQKYMKKYENEYDARTYKYLYDPSLSFDLRFHQRLSRFSFEDRNRPWCSLIFNTGTVQPLTDVLSHVYEGIENVTYEEDGEEKTVGVEYKFRRVKTPCNFVLISNDISYLYEITEKIAMYFDRIINFPYVQTLTFAEGEQNKKEMNLVGMATNIKQENLNKLDTASRGSLVMSGYSFNLIHHIAVIPDNRFNLLEKVILEVKIAKHNEPLVCVITE